MCNFYTVGWGVVGCEWGTISVHFRITYVCSIPRILLVFAVGPQYFLSLPWGPSTSIIFLFVWKTSFDGHKQNIKKLTFRFKIWMSFVGQILIKLVTLYIRGFLQLFLWCPLGSNLCKHAGGDPVTTDACTSLSRVVWRSGRSLELSAICMEPSNWRTVSQKRQFLSDRQRRRQFVSLHLQIVCSTPSLLLWIITY